MICVKLSYFYFIYIFWEHWKKLFLWSCFEYIVCSCKFCSIQCSFAMYYTFQMDRQRNFLNCNCEKRYNQLNPIKNPTHFWDRGTGKILQMDRHKIFNSPGSERVRQPCGTAMWKNANAGLHSLHQFFHCVRITEKSKRFGDHIHARNFETLSTESFLQHSPTWLSYCYPFNNGMRLSPWNISIINISF